MKKVEKRVMRAMRARIAYLEVYCDELKAQLISADKRLHESIFRCRLLQDAKNEKS